MLTLECRCGESYHAEERHIGSTIICGKCGQLIEIGPRSHETTPRASMGGQRWSPSSPATIPRRMNPRKRIVVVCGLVVLALTIGLTVGVRYARRQQQRQVLSQSGSTGATVSANGNGTRPKDKLINATSPASRPQAIPSTDPYAAILRDLDKGPVKPVSKKLRGAFTLDDLDREGPQPVKPLSHKETPHPRGTLQEIESLNPKKLPTGSAPFGPGTRLGDLILVVENGTDTDALVRVIRIQGGAQLIRNFYIVAGKSFTAREVPAGSYVLRIAFGRDWNESTRRFNFRKAFSETQHFDIQKEITEDENGKKERYGTSITLHKVLNGNFKSHPITEEEFWR